MLVTVVADLAPFVLTRTVFGAGVDVVVALLLLGDVDSE